MQKEQIYMESVRGAGGVIGVGVGVGVVVGLEGEVL